MQFIDKNESRFECSATFLETMIRDARLKSHKRDRKRERERDKERDVHREIQLSFFTLIINERK